MSVCEREEMEINAKPVEKHKSILLVMRGEDGREKCKNYRHSMKLIYIHIVQQTHFFKSRVKGT